MQRILFCCLLAFVGLRPPSAKGQAWESLDGPPGARAFALLEADGDVLLATGHGIYRLQSERWVLARAFGYNAAGARGNAVHDLVADAQGVYLAAADTGLFRISASGATLLTLSLGRIDAVKVRKHGGQIYLLCRNPNKLYRSENGAAWQTFAENILDFETDVAGLWTMLNAGGRTLLLRDGSEQHQFPVAYSEAKIFVAPGGLAVATPAGLWMGDAEGQNFALTGPEAAVSAYSPDGFLATADGVIYQNDGGVWTPIFATPIPAKINAIVGNYVLCDDYFGVYKREGNVFTPFNTGLRNVVVKSLEESGGTVYAFAAEIGTYVSGSGGRGAWEKSGAGLPFTDADAVFALAPQTAFLFSSLFQALYVTDNRGAVWKKVETFPSAQAMFRLGDGKFYACNDSAIFVSPDGRNWSPHSKPGDGFVKSLSRAGDTLFIVKHSKLHYFDGTWREYPTPGVAWSSGAKVHGKSRVEYGLTRTHGPFFRRFGGGWTLEHSSVSATAEFAGGEKLLVYAAGNLWEYEASKTETLDFVSPHWATSLAYSSDGKRIYVGTYEDGLYSAGESVSRSRPAVGPSIRVYPNPARDVVNVCGLRGESVEVFDAAGARVAEYRASGEPASLDVAGLAPGVYVMKAGDNAVRFVVVR